MIGQRIQQLRMDRQLTLTELADRAGIAKSYLSSIERGVQDNPSIQVLERLAHVLSVDMGSLIESEATVAPSTDPLDEEWLHLVREAMESGISKEQFRELLEFQVWQRQRSGDKP